MSGSDSCSDLLSSPLGLALSTSLSWSLFSLSSLFQFVGVEGLITGIMDMLPPKSALGSLRREVVAAICCIICFLIDMSMVTEVQSFEFCILFLLSFCILFLFLKAGSWQVITQQISTGSCRNRNKGQIPLHKYEIIIFW